MAYDFKHSQSGTILVLFLFFLAVLLLAMAGVIQLVNVNNQQRRSVHYQRQAYYIAEAGIERAIAQLNQNTSYTGETVNLPNPVVSGVPTIGTVTISVTGVGSTRTIAATGYAPSSALPLASETVRAQVTGSAGGGTPITFNYGTQVDDLGIAMANNSSILGNVFSNGRVIGAINTAISGSIVSAGPNGLVKDFRELGIAGNVTAHAVDHVMVAGNVLGMECRGGSLISGNLWADTIQLPGGCAVTGQIYSGVADTPSQSLPISQSQIDDWKNTAEAGGTQTGDLTIAANTSLGPKKIVGNVTINNNVTLTMTGTLWITGNLNVGNGAFIRLDASYGVNEGVLVADGRIILNQNSQMQGSGQANSYLMLLTTNNGSASPNWAIDVQNNARGAILYAGNGVINLKNNAIVKQITAKGFNLENNARLIFEAGISNSTFIDVPIGGEWTLAKGTYQHL